MKAQSFAVTGIQERYGVFKPLDDNSVIVKDSKSTGMRKETVPGKKNALA